MLAKHSSHELTEWMAYLSLEPVGEERADLRSGIVASVVANANRKKGTRPFKAEDFMPKFDKVVHEQTEEEMQLAAQTMATMFGGKVGKVSEGG